MTRIYKYKIEILPLQSFKISRHGFQLIYGSLASVLSKKFKNVHEIIPYSNILGVSNLLPNRRVLRSQRRYFYVLSLKEITELIYELDKIYDHRIEVVKVQSRVFDTEKLLNIDYTTLFRDKFTIVSKYFPIQIETNKIEFPDITSFIFNMFVFGYKHNIIDKYPKIFKLFKQYINENIAKYRLSFVNYERKKKKLQYVYPEIKIIMDENSKEAFKFFFNYLEMLNIILNKF